MGADRFTVWGGVVAALRAIPRRPVSLLSALAANILLTAILAWLREAVLSETMAGRAVAQFGFMAIDVTFGLWVMLLIASAFQPQRLSMQETLMRLRWALAPAIVVSLIDGAPTSLAEILIGEPRGYQPWLPWVFFGALGAHVAVTLGVYCTIAYASFLAFARPLTVRAALASSIALTAGSRWRLMGFGVAIFIADIVVSLATPTPHTPTQAAISQAFYTCFWVASVILLTGMGLALTRAAERHGLSLADTFD